MPRGTTLRNLRVDDSLWLPALARAEERREHLSDVMRYALERYVAGEFTLPPRSQGER